MARRGNSWTDRKRARISAGAATAAGMVALWAGPAAAGAVFTPDGYFELPEGITSGPGGSVILADADLNTTYSIAATGGTPTASQAAGFRVFGDIALTSYYGALKGTYLAFGATANGYSPASVGIASLVGATGLAADECHRGCEQLFHHGGCRARGVRGSPRRGPDRRRKPSRDH